MVRVVDPRAWVAVASDFPGYRRRIATDWRAIARIELPARSRSAMSNRSSSDRNRAEIVRGAAVIGG
jgi:hypothetical protein